MRLLLGFGDAPRRTVLGTSLWFLLVASFVSLGQGYTSPKTPFVTRPDLCGIWKLKLTLIGPASTSSNDNDTAYDNSLSLGVPSSTDKKATMPKNDNSMDDEKDQDVIVVRLNDDGTFDPYTPLIIATEEENKLREEDTAPQNLQQTLGRGGSWEYQDQCLVLAANRPENAPPTKTKDILFMGKLSVRVSECLQECDSSSPVMDDVGILSAEKDLAASKEAASEDVDVDVHLSIHEGEISTGKFFYPKKHTAFFDQPMLFQPSVTGTFHMNQLLGNLNARLKRERDAANSKPIAKYHKRDFHNRTFYLTATPHPVNKGYAALDLYYNETEAMLDLRVMPITFHTNNTFTAIGTEKILRGRYGISGKKRDSLWFQVFLFGAGRSIPGAVYSEGKLLSQDDRYGYVGPIQAYQNKHNQTTYFVDGQYYYGTDFKSARKPNSFGTFTLQEIDDDDDDDEEDDELRELDGNEGEHLDWDGTGDTFQ